MDAITVHGPWGQLIANGWKPVEATGQQGIWDWTPPAGICRICGCWDFDACLDPESGEPCSWVEPNLCSACVT